MSIEGFKHIQALVTDVDGVMTDGRVMLVGDQEAKFFSIRDGLAMKVAIDLGFPVAILTGRASQAVQRRADELGISIVKNGRLDKQLAFQEILDEWALPADQVAYVGDDLPDLPAMAMSGCGFCPQDAALDVLNRAHVVVPVNGGHGVLRWVIEQLFRAQDRWQPVIGKFAVNHA